MSHRRTLLTVALLSQSDTPLSFEQVRISLMKYDPTLEGDAEEEAAALESLHRSLQGMGYLRETNPSVWDLTGSARRLNLDPPNAYVDFTEYKSEVEIHRKTMDGDSPGSVRVLRRYLNDR